MGSWGGGSAVQIWNLLSEVLPFVFMMSVFLILCESVSKISLKWYISNPIRVGAGAQRSLIWIYNMTIDWEGGLLVHTTNFCQRNHARVRWMGVKTSSPHFKTAAFWQSLTWLILKLTWFCINLTPRLFLFCDSLCSGSMSNETKWTSANNLHRNRATVLLGFNPRDRR